MPKPGMHTGNETDSELNFAMSAKALPLFNAVKKFIAEEVEPMAAKFYALGETEKIVGSTCQVNLNYLKA